MTAVDWFSEISAKMVVFGSGGGGHLSCVCASFMDGIRALSLAS